MSLADELVKLDELRTRGVLSAEEFERAKAKMLQAEVPPAVAAMNRLRRSTSDRWIAGVCGGLAVATGIDSWIWRLIFAMLLFIGGSGLLLYILLWLFVPSE
jgi:phage shock protein C